MENGMKQECNQESKCVYIICPIYILVLLSSVTNRKVINRKRGILPLFSEVVEMLNTRP